MVIPLSKDDEKSLKTVTINKIVTTISMGASMKGKVFLLIFLVVVLSSCSFQADESSDKNDLENIEELNDEDTDEEPGNGITEEELNSKENHADILDRIINDIKNESEVYKDITLKNIKKVQDTYYVVVKVNEAEMTDHDYMLWKYDMSPEPLLTGNAIDILSKGNYYFVSYRESLEYGTKHTITKHDNNDRNYEKIIYEGGFSKFSFSPNNDYMCIQNDNEVIILNKDYEIIFKNKLYNNAENIEDGHYVDMQFIRWTKDNKKLWVATGYHAYVMTFHLIDIENSTQDTFFTGESYGITEIALNPDKSCIVYSTMPEFYESSAYEEFHNNQTIVYLYFLDLETNEKIEISKSVTKGFRPKWISNKTFEYNDPEGFTRLTFNIDDYYLTGKGSNPKNGENLWQDAEGTTPFVNDKDGNWYYNETTYRIVLKIPSIYHLDSPGVYFYWREEDGKGCYTSLTNYIYELDKNASFIENVKNIYILNNSDANENIFDNVIIEEGITDNGYKYAYFADDITDCSNDRVLSYIFVQLDDNVICRLDYRLFLKDFGKFDAKVIINSITHKLTKGLFREGFLTADVDDAVNRVYFNVPYFYIQNYIGEYYYETPGNTHTYSLNYFIDDKEEFTFYINDDNTEIEYMGKVTEGYTKNGYKYSYYLEKQVESYQPYGSERWEEVTRFITNISVRLDEYSVLKMKYVLSKEDFSLIDINDILNSAHIK